MKVWIKLAIFVLFPLSLFAQGGTNPASALSAPITLPFYTTAKTTAGKVDDVNSPAGFSQASYTTGPDWFYYFVASSSGSTTAQLSYTTTNAGVHPSISVWTGVPGSGGTLVASQISPGDNTVDGMMILSFNTVAGQGYYVMIDNWPNPSGFTYDLSIYLTPIQPSCTNIGFEDNTFTGWTATSGVVAAGLSTDPYPIYTSTGFTSSTTQHTIYTGGVDPLGGFPRVCPGLGTHSARLGDGTGTGKKGATLEQQFQVTAANALMIYYYAVVLQAFNHQAYQQPMFRIEMLDCSGNSITCGEYLVVASGSAPGFTLAPGTTDVYYKSWTPVFLDLTGYINSCVTVRFTTVDCTQSGHYGYAYIDAVCKPMDITGVTTICAGSSTTLTAPDGGDTYEWTVQGSATVLGTNSTVTVSPTVTTTYQCKITSLVGCVTNLYKTVVPDPLPTITGNLSICTSNTTQLTGSGTPDATTPWTSSNTAVATVSNAGLVTGVSNGTSTITYKNSSGCIITATVTVTTPPAITGTLNVCVGSTTQLANVGTPAASNPWISSITSNATVNSSGLVTGVAAGTSTITFTNNTGCTSTATVTVKATPSITNPGNQTVCDSYTLPVIAGSNLSGNQKYYNNSQASSGTVISGNITSTQTVWIYDISNSCKDEESFTVTVNLTPSITSPGNQTVCDSYTLPVITGTNLSGNQKYYTNSQALSGSPLSGSITTTQTVWIFDKNGTCSNEKSFLVTVNLTPNITNPGPKSACDSYTLPTILGSNLTGNQKYYSNSQLLGGTQISGSISSTQTVYIYDAVGTCKHETSFVVTITPTPSINSPSNQSVCASYSLPTITGTNLSGNQKYYNNSQALGGTVISGPIVSSQTVWIYDSNNGCTNEKSFSVNIGGSISITNPGNQTICDSYTLPTIAGVNLSGNQKYYTNSQALSGVQLSGPITTSQKVWIYDASGACKDETSFDVTILSTPNLTNPGNQRVCDSYTLAPIGGTHLSGNQKYYDNSQANGGQVISGPITSTQTVWMYDANGSCSNEKSFVVTVNHTPSLINPGNQTVCDSYLLPAITGTNLTGNEKYYTNTQLLSGAVLSGNLTTTQTVWMYDAQGACKDEKSFTVTIHHTPTINNPGNQTVCDSYTLPAISGTQLSGNQKYYNNAHALSGAVLSGPITTTQTVWIYDADGSCSDEKSFTVTVNQTPIITNPGNQTVCDSYALPNIMGTNLSGNENHYSNSQALGGTVLSGPLTNTQTIWLFDQNGNCKNEISYTVTINYTPSITNPGNQTVCDSYTLPTIAGVNLSGNQKYYTNSQALSGVQLSGPITTSQKVWIYDASGACKDETSFDVTILSTPNLTNPGNQTVCDSYTLAPIAGTHLSGNQKYYDNSQANSGQVISGPITSTQTVWMYDANGSCSNEKSFVVTVNRTPSLINPGNQTVCDSYLLPAITGTNLTGNEKYYTNTQLLSGSALSGTLTTTQTVWMYDAQGTCKDEKSFTVTIHHTPTINNPGNQTVCDSYALPTITGTQLSGNQKYYNNAHALSGAVLSGPITTSQTVWIYDADGSCSDEKSFTVTVNKTPIITNPGNQTVCDSYALPTIVGTNLSGNENHYSNSQALGGTVLSGPLTTTQTIWLFDQNGNCKNEISYTVTINYTPSITNPGNQTVCDSYTLPTIAGVNLSGNQKYYTNSQALSGVQLSGPITTSQKVWIYDASGACKDETSFDVTILSTPNLTNPGNQTVCDSYTFSPILGSNLSGNEDYFDNSQANGGQVISGPITSTQTVWMYDANGSCSNEKSFVVTVNHTPSLINPGNQTVCDSYILPAITGTNLTGNEKYYTNTQLLSGAVLSGNLTTTQTVWMYDAQGACKDEKSFTVTIHYTPTINNPGNQTVCDSYTLPAISGTQLSGNQKYYNNSQALSGAVLSGPITTTQTVWIYDADGSCSDEKSFTVNVDYTPNITSQQDVTVCDSFNLISISGAHLTGNENYYTNSQALNGSIIANKTIKTSQKIWMFDKDGNCSDEKSFVITIHKTPKISIFKDTVVCDKFDLEVIQGVNLSGKQGYYTNSQLNNGIALVGPITTSQKIYMYDSDGACVDEQSFNVTVFKTPIINKQVDLKSCDSIVLPLIQGTNLSGNQKYYSNSQINHGLPIKNVVKSSQKVWIYDENGKCSAEDSFNVVTNYYPEISFSLDPLNGCVPFEVTFLNTSINAGDSLEWNFGDGVKATVSSNQPVIKHTYTQANCFDISLFTNNKGCKNTYSKAKLVCGHSAAIADFEMDKEIGSVVNPLFYFTNKSSSDATSFSWSFGDGVKSNAENVHHEYPAEEEDYLVTLTVNNKDNCPGKMTKAVKILDELIYYVPNTFTPDGDHLNEVFLPVISFGYDPQSYTLLLYDRWGAIIFESHDVNVGWDGTFGGKESPDGTYTWTIQLKEKINGKHHKFHGHVNLLR